MKPTDFTPYPPLFPGTASRFCQTCVTIPARNEEASMTRCLEALYAQVDLDGHRLPHEAFEVLLLLNNCTDCTCAIAREWKSRHPSMGLHIIERTFSAEEAHVGTARRWLMDTAWHRLQGAVLQPAAILTTDADSVVAEDWIARNVHALALGADAVGGYVSLSHADLQTLPRSVRRRYEQDRVYASLVARLEDAFDPCAADRSPRHLDHFGSSLGCSREAYAAAGGMPPVGVLEDEAFVDRLRRANCQLRHDPKVRVSTSARLQGRATVGMAGQLRLWQGLASDEAHTVPSAAFLEHRFRTLGRLRRIFQTKDAGEFALPSDWWRNTFDEALRVETTTPGFLGAVFCDILIAETFRGEQKQSIRDAVAELEACLECHAPGISRPATNPAVSLAYEGEKMTASSVLSGSLQ